MVYYTGDIHGDISRVISFIENKKLTSEDTIVLLGDVGLNYYGDKGEKFKKQILNTMGVNILCVHGHHEMRPYSLPRYHEANWGGGVVYVEEDFPNIRFAKDGEIYNLEGKEAIVIGGAYSVDKYYRLSRGYNWFSDEQPSFEIKERVERKLESVNWKVDYVLTHTCPKRYIPFEAFLPGLDQSTVDNSTEEWLDSIENRLEYKRWLCGHWHIDKRIDKMEFLMHLVVT